MCARTRLMTDIILCQVIRGTVSNAIEAVLSFATATAQELFELPEDVLNALPFGVVGLSRDGFVESYNTTESRLAGLTPASVMHKAFFPTIGQCMNNFMVAQRLEDEAELDATVPYVLTLRMRPTPVTLRLLKSASCPRSFILIQR